MPRTRTVDAREVEPKARATFNMDELVKGGADIEVVHGGKDFEKLIRTEGFMEEIVHVRILQSGDPNAPKMCELGVGIGSMDGKGAGRDKRMGLLPGKIYPVPRFVVEVLAHSKVTALSQQQGPSGRPDDIVMVEKHSYFYPFEVVRDDNPRGRMWLEKVLADPA